MPGNISGLSPQEAILVNMAGMGKQLDNIEQKIDSQNENMSDHESRIRVLESKSCPFHGDVEDRLRGIGVALGDIKTEIEVSKLKIGVLIVIGGAIGSAIVNFIFEKLYGGI